MPSSAPPEPVPHKAVDPIEAVDAIGAVDPIWGERPGAVVKSSISLGNWRTELAYHGLENIAFAGATVVPRLFFAVRDRCWATPPTPFTYQRHRVVNGNPAEARVDFNGRVRGYPLQVSGSIVLTPEALTVSFLLEVIEDVEVSRAGPCVLLEVPRPGQPILTDVPGPEGAVTMGPDIVPHPIVSGYRMLSVPTGAGKLTIEFRGALFEMEDQRNWADNTVKSYCPPLSVPRPLRLGAGQSLPFAVRLTTDGTVATNTRAMPVVSSRPRVAALSTTVETYPLPAIGLTHPGGALASPVVELLGEIRPAFLHLLIELGKDNWASDLEDEVRLARLLGADVVVTIDCPPGARPELGAVAEIGGGSIGTAFLFGSGSAVTSVALADEGRRRFEGTGVKVGAGSRGHFASLNQDRRVPGAAEVICVALAAAAHDDDRRALTTGLGSYPNIVRQLRRLAGDREIFVGPVGFAPTFDSWSPPGHGVGVRDAWTWGHPRQATAFGAAWTVASIAALVPLRPTRVCIAAGATGKSDRSAAGAYPNLSALGLLGPLRGGPVGVVSSGERLAGLSGKDATVLALMADDPVRLGAISSRVAVWLGSPFRPYTLNVAGEDLPSPSIVVFGGSCHNIGPVVGDRGQGKRRRH